MRNRAVFSGRITDEQDAALSVDKAAALFGVDRSTLYRLTNAGQFPAPFYVGPSTPRWWRSELVAEMERRRALPREQAARRGGYAAPMTRSHGRVIR